MEIVPQDRRVVEITDLSDGLGKITSQGAPQDRLQGGGEILLLRY
jgi:hypothetical protein